MRNNIKDKIDKPLVKHPNLSKFKNINTLDTDTIIKDRVHNLYNSISNKYIIKEEEIYNKLYLKVKRMFIEEDN